MRELFTTVDSDYNPGHVIGYIIGILYMCGFIYYIYKIYLQVVFEDLLGLLDGKEHEEIYRPILYSLLNSMQFIILCFFTTFSSQSNLGVATIIGSDAFNLFLIVGLILVIKPDGNHGNIDPWNTVRDSVIYIVGLIIMLVCLITEWVEIGSSLFLLGFYICNLFILSGNQEIKEKLMEWLNLNNEDNEFNCEEHFHMKKRRYSFTQLKENGFVDPNDKELQRKLNRMEVYLAQIANQSSDKKRIRKLFQTNVYQVIYAIKAHIKLEKQRRTDRYQEIYQKKPKQQITQTREGRELQQPEIEQDEDNALVADPMQSDHMHSAQGHEVQSIQMQTKQEGPSLKMPEDLLQKIIFIIFFPVHVILYIEPNYIQNPIPKKLVLCFFMNTALLCGCYFMIDWWTLELSKATGIPIQILGLVFLGCLLSIQFLQYNLEVAKEDTQLEFIQCFLQTAICKISLCPGLPWLLRVIVELKIDIITLMEYQKAFSIGIAIFTGLMGMLLILSLVKRFRLLTEDGIILIVFYGIFLLASIIVISLNIMS